MMTADSDLLQRYRREKSQDAFAELVRRHLDLVYSAALRQVRSPQLAEEISQSVFTDLARAADKLKPDTVLTAWLYQVARRTAIDVVRRESRRQARERLAVEMAAMNTASDWTQIEPLLDEAMDALDETDRAAVLLRYFDNKSLREVGQALGTSDDAAQKRVSRAVERLREFFSKRGIAIGAAGLVVIISAEAVQAAPAGLAATISASAVLAGAAIQTSTAIAATKVIAMTTAQKTLLGLVVAAAVTTPLVTHLHAESRLREQEEALSRGAQTIASLQTNNRLLSTAAPNNTSVPSQSDSFHEMLKLRGEITGLQSEIRDRANSKTNRPLSREETLASLRQMYADRIQHLKDLFAADPSQQVPELQYLSDRTWLELVEYEGHHPARPGYPGDPDDSQLLSMARSAAQSYFGNLTLWPALRTFAKQNQGQFPTDISQLEPYFTTPVDSASLQDWTIVPMNSLPAGIRVDGDWAITQKALVNPAIDGRHVLGINSAH